MKQLASLAFVALIGACSLLPGHEAVPPGPSATAAARAPGADDPRAVPRPGDPAAPAPPPRDAVTPEDFDTTTAAERAAAARPDSPAGSLLGHQTVTLGSPARPGFWLETALVSAPAPGRVEVPGTGRSAQVDLLPAPDGAGARLSLAAMRLLGLPLTGLHDIIVYGP